MMLLKLLCVAFAIIQFADTAHQDSCSLKRPVEFVGKKEAKITPFHAFNFLSPFTRNDYREVPVLTWLENINNLSVDEVKQLKNDIVKHGVVKILNQKLSKKQQIIFSKRLGKVMEIPASFKETEYDQRYPEIGQVSNYWSNGTWKGRRYSFAQYWHKDGDFFPFNQSYILSMLYAKEFDDNIIGGGTAFIDCCSVRQDIPPELEKHIKGTIFPVDVREIPDFKDATEEELRMFKVENRNVFFRHPGKNKECLFMTKQMRTTQKGERRNLELNRLWDFMQNPKYIYKVTWKSGDIVIWDNFATFHRALPTADRGLRRILHRTLIQLDTNNIS